MKHFFKNEYFWLAIIFLAVLFFRLFFVLQTDIKSFSSDFAYFHFREIESLSKDFDFGLPYYYDELSYSGRTILYLPMYHYILSLFGMVFGLFFAVKLLPEIMISALIILAYYLAKEVSNSKGSALIAALMSGFVPALFRETLNQLSIYSFVLPVFFLMIYFMMRMRLEKQKLTYFAVLAILFPLLHPASFLLAFSLLFYILIILSESLNLRRINKEAILFCIITTFLVQFLIFRGAFLMYGVNVIWQNVPRQILSGYFSNLEIFKMIYEVGLIPIILGVLALYLGFTSRHEPAVQQPIAACTSASKSKASTHIMGRDQFFLLCGVLFSVFVLLLLKLITINVGLMFLGVTFSVLSSITLAKFSSYLKLTKFLIFKGFFIILLLVLLGITFVYPSYNTAKESMLNVPLAEDMHALEWMAKNIDGSAVILANYDEGHLVSAVTGKKNVIDNLFLFAPDAEQRLVDVDAIYLTGSEARALELAKKYGIDYIFLSERSKQKYKLVNLGYADGKCFKRVKYDEPKIYKVRC